MVALVVGVLVIGCLVSEPKTGETASTIQKSMEGAVVLDRGSGYDGAAEQFAASGIGPRQAQAKLDIALDFYPEGDGVTVTGEGSYTLSGNTYEVNILPNQKIERMDVGNRVVYVGMSEAECETDEGVAPCNLAIAHDITSDTTMVNVAIGYLGNETLLQFGTNPLTWEEINDLRSKQKRAQDQTVSDNVLRATGSTQYDLDYWDKGRNYTKTLQPTSLDVSTMVISAHAYYDPATALGRERIRVWGRNDTVRRYYPSPWYIVAGVNQANLRFYVDSNKGPPYYQPGANELAIYATSPANNSTSTTLAAVLYDLLGYKSIPTGVLSIFVDSLFASTERVEADSCDNTVIFRAGALGAFGENTSLPNTIKYEYADEQDGTGITAKFAYQLPSGFTDFCVWPQAQIKYLIFTYEGGFFYVSSGAAGVPHTVNTVKGHPTCHL